MLAQGEASDSSANPGYARRRKPEPRRGDRNLCGSVAPTGLLFFFAPLTQGLRWPSPRFTLGYHRSPLRG